MCGCGRRIGQSPEDAENEMYYPGEGYFGPDSHQKIHREENIGENGQRLERRVHN